MKYGLFLLAIVSYSTEMNAVAGPDTGAFKLSEVRIENDVVCLHPTVDLPDSLNYDKSSRLTLAPQDAGFDQRYRTSLTTLASAKTGHQPIVRIECTVGASGTCQMSGSHSI